MVSLVQETGDLKIGQFAGVDCKGKVFSGGSSEVFDTLLGARNKVASLLDCRRCSPHPPLTIAYGVGNPLRRRPHFWRRSQVQEAQGLAVKWRVAQHTFDFATTHLSLILQHLPCRSRNGLVRWQSSGSFCARKRPPHGALSFFFFCCSEIRAMHASKGLSKRLKNLDFLLAEVYRDLDYNTTEPPACDAVGFFGVFARVAVAEFFILCCRFWRTWPSPRRNMTLSSTATLAAFFAAVGSLRAGVFSRNVSQRPCVAGTQSTFFAYQTKRYADLYATSYINLMNYPFCYRYIAREAGLPHEK